MPATDNHSLKLRGTWRCKARRRVDVRVEGRAFCFCAARVLASGAFIAREEDGTLALR